MDKALLKKAALQSVALMLGVIMLSYAIKRYNSIAISASTNEDISPNMQQGIGDFDQGILKLNESEFNVIDHADIDVDVDPVVRSNPIFLDTTIDFNNDILEQIGNKYLIIRKPQGEELKLQFEDIYITKNLKLIISGFMRENPDVNYIGRINKEDVFVGEPKFSQKVILEQEDGIYTPIITRDYGNDPVNDIIIKSQTDDFGYSVYEITLQLDHVYAHILYEDDYFYYIDLKRPKEVYDKILVIDAGHGGTDPGALSKDELTYEKNLNLKILLELKELLKNRDIKVYYTRINDDKIFLRPRVNLANDVDCDFFISIHCNSGGDYKKINGTEILYYDHVHKGISSKDMAKIFSEEISKIVPLKNKGIIQMKNDDVLILHHAKVPAIIVESGYMSNRSDLEYLMTKEGQAEIAEGIYNGILRAYEELMP